VATPRQTEGKNEGIKTPALVNNNPGNLIYAGQEGADKNGKWAKFKSPEEGFKALQTQISLDANPNRKHTLKSFLHKYAPAQENNTTKYINDILKLTRNKELTENTPLITIVEKVGKKELAKIISKLEDVNMYEKIKNL
jgi:hypothetical protein